MKKNILIALILLFSCSKDDITNNANNNSTLDTNPIDKIISSYGIRPSNKDKITLIEVRDEIKYKLAAGRKNNNAWIAKFSPSGDELFSLEIDNIEERFKYGQFKINSIVEIIDDILFIKGVYSNTEDAVFPSDDFDEFLSIVDFINGEEKHRIYSPYRININYKIISINDFYFIQESETNYQSSTPIRLSIHLINADGYLIWERECKDYENYRGIDYYYPFVFIDSERIIYDVQLKNVDYLYFKIINLRKSEFLFEPESNSIQIDAGLFHIIGIKYSIIPIILKDKIRIVYDAMKWVNSTIVDQITGETIDNYEHLGTLYYDFDINTYKLLESGKF
jgi:hypothetical protein